MRNPVKLAVWIACGFALSFAAFFVVGETIARAFDVIDRLSPYPRSAFVHTEHPGLPYRLRPGFSGEVLFTEVRVNDAGLRGDSIDARPSSQASSAGSERILVLGDSIVFGHMLEENDTFSVQLERELRRLGRGNAEVLNGGVSGYNTAAELAFLETYGLPLNPSALIVGVSFNDVDDVPFIGYSGVLTQDDKQRMPDSWLVRHSEFYLLLDWVLRYLRGEHAFQDAVPGGDGLGDGAFQERQIAWRRQQAYADLSAPGWLRVRRSVAGLRDAASARGMELLFVLFPERFQMDQAVSELAPQRAWLGLCRELRVRCLNLWPAFAAGRNRASSGSGGDSALFLDVQHPSASGMAIAARALAEEWGRRDVR